jgi:hypothetical protein
MVGGCRLRRRTSGTRNLPACSSGGSVDCGRHHGGVGGCVAWWVRHYFGNWESVDAGP